LKRRSPSRLAAPERPSGPCRRRRKSPCGLKPLSQHSPDPAALQGQDHLLVRLGQRQILLRVRAGGKKTASWRRRSSETRDSALIRAHPCRRRLSYLPGPPGQAGAVGAGMNVSSGSNLALRRQRSNRLVGNPLDVLIAPMHEPASRENAGGEVGAFEGSSERLSGIWSGFEHGGSAFSSRRRPSGHPTSFTAHQPAAATHARRHGHARPAPRHTA